jgi:hypothetical protein
MHNVLEDIDLLLAPTPGDPKVIYDRVASQYEHFRVEATAIAYNEQSM